MIKKDVIIIGAGASGLMCAIEAGKRRRNVLVLEHNQKIGEKISISGGGKCNFTNTNATSVNYISQNPYFCKSALARFTPADFLRLVKKHGISYNEKKLGQIFCIKSANEIIHVLLEECRTAGVEIQTGANIFSIDKKEKYILKTQNSIFESGSLVMATGGLSFPKLGSTNYGYRIADQFGIKVIPTKPGLVPLNFSSKIFKNFQGLTGISFESVVTCNGFSFRENILFTHQGLSGPAILQASSYWHPGDSIYIDLLPEIDISNTLKKYQHGKKLIATILEQFLPSRFIRIWLEQHDSSKFIHQCSTSELRFISNNLKNWVLFPIGTKGYTKAEVTVGGIDTNALSSKTMEAKKVPGLYFIGELVDVTGWLGGYNLQWAWSSGWAAGQVV